MVKSAFLGELRPAPWRFHHAMHDPARDYAQGLTYTFEEGDIFDGPGVLEECELIWPDRFNITGASRRQAQPDR